MVFGLTITTGEMLSIGIPAALAVLSWATFVTKMLWDIRTDVSERSARQDTTLDDHERRIERIENVVF